MYVFSYNLNESPFEETNYDTISHSDYLGKITLILQ